jgi:ubiquinone/menaquinone biosynthesis C-methylase UbiE
VANTPALQRSEALREKQYKTPQNLEARIALHAGFSVNRKGWMPWLFEQIEAPAGSRILELGCGPAFMWRENLTRVPESWRLLLSDFSPGMLDAAREVFEGSGLDVRFELIDAGEIPHDDASFDLVLANHMLYHVPDLPRTLAEIRRVLAPSGRVFASTLARDNMTELWDLVREVASRPEFMRDADWVKFSLDNGREQLDPFFVDLELRRYEDALRITEVEPVVDYVRSSPAEPLLESELAELARRVGVEISKHGAFYVGKDAGVFIGKTPG